MAVYVADEIVHAVGLLVKLMELDFWEEETCFVKRVKQYWEQIISTAAAP